MESFALMPLNGECSHFNDIDEVVAKISKFEDNCGSPGTSKTLIVDSKL